MISQTAIETLEDLRAEGLSPSDADVIRLNAYGLKLEAAAKKRATHARKYLPRLAAISPDIAFREPTIGHDLWFAKVARLDLSDDFETALALRAYALTRGPSKLCDPEDPRAVREAVAAALPAFAEFTREQIYAAISYVTFGASPIAGELPARAPASDDETFDEAAAEDWTSCVAVGNLNEGRAVLYGVSEAELRELTNDQLVDLVSRAYAVHGQASDVPDVEAARNEFYAVKAEIKNRLLEEKNGR